MRRALMVSLQDQLEAALSAALAAAVNARDVITCRSSYTIFDCEDEERDEESAAVPVRYAEFLCRFFPEFAALIEEERTFAMARFPNPQYTLSAFIQAALDAFSPPFAQRLSGMTEHYGSAALPELVS
ncbi:hypothetical protein BOTBODRAFT_177508 [Botryobasidium botryosum FD-172 SS1]|uniref:Uncharacterized protein n=1 Tax=Botryobasidium botryosum (strain FD-172 SS1) TaxID=930990 RepID=A0A067M988_BOTB1|nr:hypothetical protein BOTBODRAFT_177508 [Botryobasidium botryosum FD-172 SS1]